MEQAEGLLEMQKYQAAGFTDDEITQWRADESAKLEAAGFSQVEINEYFGDKTPDMSKVEQTLKDNLARPVEGTPEGGPKVKEATTFLEALEAGWDMSVTGLMDEAPDVVLNQHPDMFMKIASQVGTLAGDLPAMAIGAVGGAFGGGAAGAALGTATLPVIGTVGGAAGGALVGGGAGAMALPEALRTVMVEHYEKGDVKSFSDFWERTSAVTINSLKAGVIGGLTAGVGGKVGTMVAKTAMPVVAKSTAVLASEVATMTTVGKGLEGQVPEPEDFLEGAILVGGFHAVTSVSTKMYKTYAKTGMKPEDVVIKAEQDPHFKQQILSENVEVPVNAEIMGPSSMTKPKPPEKFETTKPLKEPLPEQSADVLTILSNVGEKPEAPKKKYSFNQFYTDFVDKLDPINRATKELTDNVDSLPAEKNPYVLSRMANDAPAKAKHFFEKGTFDYETLANNGKGLKEIISKAEDLNVLEAYMISKRAIEKSNEGKTTGFDIEAAKKVVAEHKEKYEPIAKEVTEFSNRTLEYVQKSGVISKEQLNTMKEANKNYVPFKRIFEVTDEIGAKKGGGKAGSLKAFKGSERAIQNPLTSIVENTVELIRIAEINRPKVELVKMAAKAEGQDLIKFVPDKTKAIKVSAEEMVKSLEESGAVTTINSIKKNLEEKGIKATDEVILEAFKNEDLFQVETVQDMVIYRKQQSNLTPQQFSVYMDGKRRVFETTPELAQAIKSLDGDATSTNLLFRIMHGITSVKKLGITFTLDFQIKNLFRDTLQGSAMTKSKGISPVEVVGAMGDLLKKNDVYWEWMKSGGAQGAFLDLGESYIKKDFLKLQRETNFLNSARNIVEKPIDLMRVAAELSEKSIRLAEYKKIRKMGLSIQEGGFSAREITLDFQRVGAKMSALNSITAFQNVSIQGLDRAARAFKEDPKGLSQKAFTYITMPSILLWWANKDDERVKEIPRWEKDHFWIIATDDWVDATEDEVGGLPEYMVRSKNGKMQVNKGTIYRLPKPQEFGLIFGSLPERVLEKFFADNPRAMKDFDETMLNIVTPSIVPDALAPAMEQFFNKSFFTGRDIIPHHLKNIMPEYQFVEYSSETAKTIGKMVATVDKHNDFASPIILDNYIQSWGGSLGKYAVQTIDQLLVASGVAKDNIDPTMKLSDVPFVKSFVVRFPRAGSVSVQDFYDNFEKLEKFHNTLELLGKRQDMENLEKEMSAPENQEMYLRLTTLKQALSNQSRAIIGIHQNPDLTADEKRQMIDGLYLMMSESAKQGNLMVDEFKKSLEENK